MLGDAGGFRRQRPALADVPVRLVDAVPIHFVRANAAQQRGIRHRPAILGRVAVLHQRDARALRIDDEPDRRVAAAVPVLHRLEPLVLRRRRQRPSQSRHRGAHPGDRPPEIERLPAVHRQNRRVPQRSRDGSHVVQQPKGRRLLPRVGRNRRPADVRAEHRDPDRDGHARVPPQAPRPFDRQIRHRHHQRQRVAPGERLLEQQIEEQVRTEAGGEPHPRAWRTTAHGEEPDERHVSTTTASGHAAHGATNA